MYKRIVLGRVELWDACFAKILKFDLAAHELTHVVFKRFSSEGHFG